MIVLALQLHWNCTGIALELHWNRCGYKTKIRGFSKRINEKLWVDSAKIPWSRWLDLLWNCTGTALWLAEPAEFRHGRQEQRMLLFQSDETGKNYVDSSRAGLPDIKEGNKSNPIRGKIKKMAADSNQNGRGWNHWKWFVEPSQLVDSWNWLTFECFPLLVRRIPLLPSSSSSSVVFSLLLR